MRIPSAIALSWTLAVQPAPETDAVGEPRGVSPTESSAAPQAADTSTERPETDPFDPEVEAEPSREAEPAPLELAPEPQPTYAVEGSGVVTSTPTQRRAEYIPDPRHRRLQVTGAILVGTGCAAFVAMVAGLGVSSSANNQLDLARQREPVDEGRVDELEDRQKLGRGLAIGGGAAAGVLIVGGIATMAVGYRRARAHYEHYLDTTAHLELAPGPGELGGGVRLRF